MKQKYIDLVNPLINIAKNAGEIILEHYNQKINVTIKDDNSPVTSADLAANDYIIANLRKIAPDINIVSEEKKNKQFTNKDIFFLVDPLDGTKSYIDKSGEFTVNIAIVENGNPVLGVVYIPVTKSMYYTNQNGAYRSINNEKAAKIHARKPAADLVVMASKSHISKETKDFINSINVKELNPAGSSLKFCRIAEGVADIYPRFAPTMEWDTAAAHAILLASGGNIINPDGSKFIYGKKDYKNGYFIAKGLDGLL